MTVSINSIHSGGGQNFSGAGISNSQAGTISTNGEGQTVVLIFATARTDTATNVTRISGVTATGLTFTEVFDELIEYNVGGSFPITNWHLQMFVAPAFAQVTNLAWSTTMSAGFANQISCIGFAVAGIGNYTAPFDGELDATAAVSYYNSDSDTALDQPSVNLTTGDANTLLLSIFVDSAQDGDAQPAVLSANTGYTGVANVASTRQYAIGNLFAQYKTVTSTQAAVAQEPAASTRKFWQAVTLAFTETGTAPASVARVTKEAAEVLHDGAPSARVTKEAAEVLHNGAPSARISGMFVEVLRAVAIGTDPTSDKRPVICVIT